MISWTKSSARAWQHFTDRPRHLPIDLWLIHLLHDTLEQWVKQEPRGHASLEEEAGETSPDDVPQVDGEEWWVPLLGEEETFTLGDLIPDLKGTAAWERLDAKEQKTESCPCWPSCPRSSDRRSCSILWKTTTRPRSPRSRAGPRTR